MTVVNINHLTTYKEKLVMIIKKETLKGMALGVILGCSGAIFAQAPAVDIGARHGNLRAAQQYIASAWQRIDEAQADNHYELGGHAGRAKELLVQADQELRLAANVANSNER
jgi:hypothetical protein